MPSPAHSPSRSSRRARGGALRLVPTRPSESEAARFRYRHLWLPLALFAVAVVAIETFALDWRIARAVYDWQGYRWLLKHWFVTETLIHRVGRNASIAAWLGVAVAWAVAMRRDAYAAWRAPLGYLALSVLLTTLAVSWVKSWSNMDCPWDIDGLGGVRPYLSLFEARSTSLPHASCFPAGHASGGYAWMALYFFFAMTKPQWRRRGLAVGAIAGLVFGLGQQLRGAHFLSHDVWTAAICWFGALGVYTLFVSRAERRERMRRWEAIGRDGASASETGARRAPSFER
jgi:membrane-associated PAP2 superfamily phosphatase